MHGEFAVSGGTGVSAAELLRALQAMEPAGDDAARVEQIRLLEEIKSAAAAVQAQVTSVL